MQRANRLLVITRSAEQSATFAEAARAIGFEILLFPTIEIKPVELTSEMAPILAKLDQGYFDWAVFTSVNAARALHTLRQKRLKPEKAPDFPAQTKVAVVGDKTRSTFEELYLRKINLMPQRFTGEALVDELQKNELAGQKILLLQGSKNRDLIKIELRKIGALVEELVVYKNLSCQPEPGLLEVLRQAERPIFTFFSPSAVESTVSFLSEEKDLLLRSEIVSIGPITSEALNRLGLEKHRTSTDHSEEGVLNLLKSLR